MFFGFLLGWGFEGMVFWILGEESMKTDINMARVECGERKERIEE